MDKGQDPLSKKGIYYLCVKCLSLVKTEMGIGFSNAIVVPHLFHLNLGAKAYEG